MRPADRTRPATRADSKTYIGKAREFLAEMEVGFAAGRWDAAGLAAIHAGISAADAVLAYEAGVRSAGRDHQSSVDLLIEVVGPPAARPSKHLKRLVDKKNLVEYEQRRLIESESRDLVVHARRFVDWADGRLPPRAA
jgi:hypothetical protein